MDKEKDGVWRTIRGRRIFIRSGESLGSAMSRSGKFKGITREKLKDDIMTKSVVDRINKRKQSKIGLPLNNKKNEKIDRKNKQHLANKGYINEKYYNPDNQAFDNRINETDNYYTNAKTRVERNKLRYSKAQQRELKHEELQKKLADYRKEKGIQASMSSEEYNKRLDDEFKKVKEGKITDKEYYKRTQEIMDNYKTPRMGKEQTYEANKKAIEDFKAKKQSNNRVVENTKTGERYKELNNGQWRSEKDGYDYYLDMNSKNKDNPQYKEVKQSNNKIETYEEYKNRLLNDDNYLQANRPNEYFRKTLKEQGNNKVETERELYERAKNNPESIDPMTENSTDWEALEKKYGKEEKIKKYVEKKKGKSDKNAWLPKETEIKEQGKSNRKEVSENIQAHILSYYDKPEDFISQMDVFSNLPTNWHRGEEIAKGGSYLIYNGDMADFLDKLKINPKGKKFSEDKAFNTYTSLIGRESAKLYDRIKKHQADTINNYKKKKGK